MDNTEERVIAEAADDSWTLAVDDEEQEAVLFLNGDGLTCSRVFTAEEIDELIEGLTHTKNQLTTT